MSTGHFFDPEILREYDIRGIVGKNLTSLDALALGRTLGTLAGGEGGRIAVVGYDGRLSSVNLAQELSRGLAASGFFIASVGLVPTPCMYFATRMLQATLGIMVTGSHNPAEYNGFKITLKGKPFFGEELQRLGNMARAGGWVSGDGGILDVDARDAYVARVAADYRALSGLNVGWDPGNGAAAQATQDLTRRLKGTHQVINAEIDGSFPNHPPDPTVVENLSQLRELVLRENLDLGIAFDGDGDRIGIVDDQGEAMPGDQILILLAHEILKTHPGAPVLADVKASRILFAEIERLGGVPVMCPTGHSIIKDMMVRHKAPLAGEMSGHIFIADRYFGYDDALYAAVRLVCLLARDGRKLSLLRSELPVTVNTPELRIPCPEARKFAVIEEVKARLLAQGADLDQTDGVRVTEADGWWLLRASNTQDALVARCESGDRAGLRRLLATLAGELTRSQVAHEIDLTD